MANKGILDVETILIKGMKNKEKTKKDGFVWVFFFKMQEE